MDIEDQKRAIDELLVSNGTLRQDTITKSKNVGEEDYAHMHVKNCCGKGLTSERKLRPAELKRRGSHFARS